MNTKLRPSQWGRRVPSAVLIPAMTRPVRPLSVYTGTSLLPPSHRTERLLHFAVADVTSAMEQVQRYMQSAGPSKDEQTSKDHRVIEEAFCEKCGTHRPCRSFARQTRSADEGQTIFFQCTICNSEWSHNS